MERLQVPPSSEKQPNELEELYHKTKTPRYRTRAQMRLLSKTIVTIIVVDPPTRLAQDNCTAIQFLIHVLEHGEDERKVGLSEVKKIVWR